MWAVTNMAVVPPGSILINPQVCTTVFIITSTACRNPDKTKLQLKFDICSLDKKKSKAILQDYK